MRALREALDARAAVAAAAQRVRTVFLGTSDVRRRRARTARRAASTGPSLVVTRPDRPRGPRAQARRRRRSPTRRARWASRSSSRSGQRRRGRARGSPRARPDVVVRVRVRRADQASRCCRDYEMLNVHPSLLPRWRGAAPIERAIMAGDARDRRVDHARDGGPGQRARVPAASRADPPRRHLRLARGAARATWAASCCCARSTSARRSSEQDDDGATYADKIDAGRPHARPVAPGGSSSSASSARCTRTSARASRCPTAIRCACSPRRRRRRAAARARWAPRDGRLLLGCAEGALELLAVQPPGGGRCRRRPTCAATACRGPDRRR